MPKQTIECKFSMDQKVRVKHTEQVGMITCINYSDCGVSYYVETKNNPTWQVERYLEDV